MSKKYGFVGMGVMGAPMAGHLVTSGRNVTVWNRHPEKSKLLVEKGATLATDLASLAKECDVIFTCVGKTEDVAEVTSELAKHAKPGTLFIDHSTISPVGAVQIGEHLASKGMRFVDAPVTGGSVGAVNGTLTIFLGGSEKDVEEALDAVKPFAKNAARVGESGKGQMMKLANQIAVGGALIAMCESIAFAEKAGLDPSQARAMIGSGSGGSWAFENYGPKVLNRDWTPGFSIKNQRKDFGYCKETAKEIGANIPCTDVVDEWLGKLQAVGRGEDTTAALFEALMQS